MGDRFAGEAELGTMILLTSWYGDVPVLRFAKNNSHFNRHVMIF